MDKAVPDLCCAALPRANIGGGGGVDPAVLAYYMAEQVRFAHQRQLLNLMCAIMLAGQLDDGAAPFADLVQHRIPQQARDLCALRPDHVPTALAPLLHHADQVTVRLCQAAEAMQAWLYRQGAEPLMAMLVATTRLLDHCASLLPGADIVDRDTACCAAPTQH